MARLETMANIRKSTDPTETDETRANPPTAARKPLWQRLAPLGAIALGIGLVFAFDLDRYLSLSTLEQHKDALKTWVEANAVVASGAYLLAYAVAVGLSIPGAAILTISGGLLFGVWWGSALAVTGATLGAVAIFLAARTALGDILRQRAGGWIARLEDGFRENAVSYMLTLRLIPVVPFWLVNLVPAFLGVSLIAFAGTTFFGIIPGTVVYVSVGNGLAATLEAGQDPNLSIIFQPEILLPLLGLALLSLIPVAVKRQRGAPIAPSQPTGDAKPSSPTPVDTETSR